MCLNSDACVRQQLEGGKLPVPTTAGTNYGGNGAGRGSPGQCPGTGCAAGTRDVLGDTPCARVCTRVFALRNYLAGGTACHKVCKNQVRFYGGFGIQTSCEDIHITKKLKGFWKDVLVFSGLLLSIALCLDWCL